MGRTGDLARVDRDEGSVSSSTGPRTCYPRRRKIYCIEVENVLTSILLWKSVVVRSRIIRWARNLRDRTSESGMHVTEPNCAPGGGKARGLQGPGQNRILARFAARNANGQLMKAQLKKIFARGACRLTLASENGQTATALCGIVRPWTAPARRLLLALPPPRPPI